MTLPHHPRIYLHYDGQVVSIGFEDGPDTLLFLHGPPSENYGDAARLKEFVASVQAALERDRATPSREELR